MLGEEITIPYLWRYQKKLGKVLEGSPFLNVAKIPYEFAFYINSDQIETPYFNLNTVRFIPTMAQSIRRAIELGEREAWKLRRLGDIANVFNGPRFKRPYAAEGVIEGKGIVPYYTGTAFTQTKGDNIKYLDRNRATDIQRKQLDQLTIHEGWMITEEGFALFHNIFNNSLFWDLPNTVIAKGV